MHRKAFAVAVAGMFAAAAACSSFEDAPSTAEPDGGESDGRARPIDDASSADVTTAADADAGADASASTIYRDAVLSAGPIAYWRMSRVETSNTLVPDETINAAPLSLSGVQIGVPGIFAGDPAISFGGVGFAEATSSSILEFVGVLPYSLECWARHDGQVDGGSFFEHVLAFVDGTPGGSQDGYLMYLQNEVPPKMIGFRDAYDAAAQQAPSTFPNDHEWHHHVMTFDGSTVRMYLDGQPKGNVDMNAPIGARPNRKLTVGGASNEPGRYFNGALAEIAVYPKTLDVVTIAKHFDLGKPK